MKCLCDNPRTVEILETRKFTRPHRPGGVCITALCVTYRNVFDLLLGLRSTNWYGVTVGSIFGVVNFEPSLDHVSDDLRIQRSARDIKGN